MASLIKQDGNFYLQFHDGQRRPKRKRVALKVSVARDARRISRQLEALYAEGKYDPWVDDALQLLRELEGKRCSEAVTLQEAIARFITAKRSSGKEETTLTTYRHILNLLAQRAGTGMQLQQIPTTLLFAYCHDRSVKKATRRSRYRHVRAFLRWCVRKGYLSSDPLQGMEAPSEADKLPKAVRPNHVDAMEQALLADYEDKLKRGECRAGELVWMARMWRFAMYTGLRVSELARLRWRDVDPERRLLFLHKQKNHKEQTIPLVAKALQALPERGAPEAYVFGPPGTQEERSTRNFREYVSAVFRTYRRAAGLPEGLTFHGLRHGFCTLLAEAGVGPVTIKEAARHGDISTTMRYVHLAREKLREDLDRALV